MTVRVLWWVGVLSIACALTPEFPVVKLLNFVVGVGAIVLAEQEWIKRAAR